MAKKYDGPNVPASLGSPNLIFFLSLFLPSIGQASGDAEVSGTRTSLPFLFPLYLRVVGRRLSFSVS